MSEKSIERRWTLHICDECSRPGHVFQESRPCDYGGRHHGKHGGPVEVMPVEQAERLEVENEELRELTIVNGGEWAKSAERVDALEAELAKAQKALEFYRGLGEHS